MYALQSEPEQGQRWRVLTIGAAVGTLLQAAAFCASSMFEIGHVRMPPQTVQMRVIRTQPAPPRVVEEPRAVEPKPDVPVPPPPRPSPKTKPVVSAVTQPVVQAAPPEQATTSQTAPLIVGLTLSSTTSNPQGARFAVGSTLMGVPERHATTPQRGHSRAATEGVSSTADSAYSKPHVEAKLVKGLSPVYPIQAKKEGVEGLVVLSIVINTRGQVESAKVLQGLGHGLDESALSAVRQTLWEPAMIGGQPVNTKRRFNVRFTLT